MARISYKGVIIGGVVDIVASNVLAIPVGVYAFMTAGIAALPKAEQGPALVAAMQNRPSIYLTELVLGSLCSVLGGYLAARIAKHDERLNGALSSVFCIGFGVYALIKGTLPSSPWLHALLFVLSPALGLAGALLYLRGKRRRAGAAPTAA